MVSSHIPQNQKDLLANFTHRFVTVRHEMVKFKDKMCLIFPYIKNNAKASNQLA